jgi:hypothetical protein
MAVDTLQPVEQVIPATHRTTAQLIAMSARDSDTVSCFVNGTSWADARSAIFIVKGGTDARAVHELLKKHGLITDNPVVPA